jgi:hypothetical protein
MAEWKRLRRVGEPTKVARGLLGVGLVAVGLTLSYDLFVSPDQRVGGAIDAFMYFGPVILSIGVFFLWRVHAAPRPTHELAVGPRLTGLLKLGLALLAIPVASLVFTLITGPETSILFAISFIVLGLPGLVLVAVGLGPRLTGLLKLGMALLAIPVVWFVYNLALTGNEFTGLGFMSFYVLGLPGLVLVVVGIYRAQRR